MLPVNKLNSLSSTSRRGEVVGSEKQKIPILTVTPISSSPLRCLTRKMQVRL